MGYIKIDRNILQWGWKDVPEMVALWIEILLQANYAEREYHGETFERGTFPTSLEKLSLATGLSVRQVRTCLDRLTKSGEITMKSTNRGTKIIVEKWALYQGCDSDSDKQTTNKRQTTDKQTTTLKEINKEKKEKNINNKRTFGEYQNVRLSESEYEKLLEDYGEVTERAISFLDAYIEEKGYKSKSHYLAIRRWVIDAVPKEKHVEQLETYDASNNPILSNERREELKKRRAKC